MLQIRSTALLGNLMVLDPRSPLLRHVASLTGPDPGTDAVAAREAADVLARIQAFASGEAEALAWYHDQPIAALGGRTADTLVRMGQGAALRQYLDALATGGFACPSRGRAGLRPQQGRPKTPRSRPTIG